MHIAQGTHIAFLSASLILNIGCACLLACLTAWVHRYAAIVVVVGSSLMKYLGYTEDFLWSFLLFENAHFLFNSFALISVFYCLIKIHLHIIFADFLFTRKTSSALEKIGGKCYILGKFKISPKIPPIYVIILFRIDN